MADIKISELAETTDLQGLYTIGTDKNNLSKKVSLEFVKDAANYANQQGDYAKDVGDSYAGRINDLQAETNAKLTELESEVVKIKVLVESGASGGGAGQIIVKKLEYLNLLDVPKGTIVSVVVGADKEVNEPLSKMYDFFADGGDISNLDYTKLDRMVDVAFTFPNTLQWSVGRIVLGSESANTRYYFETNATRVGLRYVQNEQTTTLTLADNNGGTITLYDDVIADVHNLLRGINDLCYIGVANSEVSVMEQFFEVIRCEVNADAYILAEKWERLMKDGETAEIDLSALATKDEVIENEEVVAAALNDLNDNKASKADVANAIAEAITNTLNTAV